MTECKEIPRKNTCLTIQGPRRVKDFTLEVHGASNFDTCNMLQVLEGKDSSDEDGDFHGWDIPEGSGVGAETSIRDEEGEEVTEATQGDGPQEVYNTMQDLTISTRVFEEGILSKSDFGKAQENDVRLTEAIREGMSNIHIQINSILIHVSEHLSYLYRLLAEGNNDSGITLAISEKERIRVLEGTKNQSKN